MGVCSIFISGPMTGMPNHNYEEFNRVEEQLKPFYDRVVNPVHINEAYDHGDIKGWDWLSTHPADLREAFEWEWKEVRKCDAIYLLRGWEKSPGALREFQEAIAHKKEVVFQNEVEIGLMRARLSYLNTLYEAYGDDVPLCNHFRAQLKEIENGKNPHFFPDCKRCTEEDGCPDCPWYGEPDGCNNRKLKERVFSLKDSACGVVLGKNYLSKAERNLAESGNFDPKE